MFRCMLRHRVVHLAFGHCLAVAIHSDGQLVARHPDVEGSAVIAAELVYNMAAVTGSPASDGVG